ncbi:MAG: hypothetical protein AAGF11_41010 [Myxococcota bacterium]
MQALLSLGLQTIQLAFMDGNGMLTGLDHFMAGGMKGYGALATGLE